MIIKLFFALTIVALSFVSSPSQQSELYKESHALVIGNSEYQFWDKLIGVKADVPEVTKALQEQGFTVETETNLTSANLKARVEKFINDYGFQRDSRLLIYFAGHGTTYQIPDEDREVGYIVPVDTPRLPVGTKVSEQAEAAFLRKAISMDTFDGWAKNVKSRHALFVFDSCFSGRFVPRSEIRPSEIVKDALSKPTRQFLTSGAANQTASDNSEFRKAFVQGLRGDADSTEDGFVTVTELAIFVRDRVAEYSQGKQTPQYGTIREAALDGGDMVFQVSAEYKQKNEEQAQSAWKRVIKNDPDKLRAFIEDYPNTTRGREAVSLLGKLEQQTTKRNPSNVRQIQPRITAQKPEREQPVNREIESEPIPAPKFSVTKDSITFTIKKCELSDKDLICSFSIVSNGKDIDFDFDFFGNLRTSIVDNDGNQVFSSGNTKSSNLLVAEIPISGTISFKTDNSNITSIARLDFRYNSDGGKDITFRNVPVRRVN